MVYYLHTDHLGSTSLTTSAGGGELLDSRTWYYPYGEVRAGGSTLPTDYTYTGQRDEGGVGLMDYQARFYDPYLGRFISADAIVPHPANPQDLNRYSYARNSPLVYVDPSGHAATVDPEGNVIVRLLGDGQFMLLEHPAITERSEWLLSNWVLTHDPKYYLAAALESRPATGNPAVDTVLLAEVYADHDSAIAKMGSWPIYYQGVDWEWLMDTSHGGGILAEVYRANPELFWMGMASAGMVAGDGVADELLGPPTVFHHTVPVQILSDFLPDEVANDPQVRGTKGAPNRWAISTDLHRRIHRGPRGGPYNARWREEIGAIRVTGREVTVDDVLRIRNQLVVEFGLEGYRP